MPDIVEQCAVARRCRARGAWTLAEERDPPRATDGRGDVAVREEVSEVAPGAMMLRKADGRGNLGQQWA